MYGSEKQSIDASIRKAVALLFGATASILSIGIAVLAARQMSSDLAEAWTLSGVGVAAVLGAHGVPAHFRPASLGMRLLALVVWVACSSYLIYGYGNFFLTVQERAGKERLAAFESRQPMLDEPGASGPRRPISAVLADMATVKALQARIDLSSCDRNCAVLKARDAALGARLVALAAEETEVRQARTDRERMNLERQSIQANAVTARLVSAIGLNPGRVDLAMAILVAVILEGTGALCWFAVLQCRDSTVTGSTSATVILPAMVMPPVNVTAEVATTVSRSPIPTVTSAVSADAGPGEDPGELAAIPPKKADSRQGEVLLLVERVRQEVQAGRVRSTVSEIRDYLGCAQATAAAVRRAL